ncbi:MAG: hypothetical protein U0R17_01150 [Acidimicrobiia bacterium]
MKNKKTNDEGFVLVTVLSICFLAVMVIAAITTLTIADLVSTSRNRATIEARNTAESTLDTLYAVVNRGNTNDLIATANKDFIAPDGSSPISNQLEQTLSSGTTYNKATVITQVYKWSNKYYSVDEDGLLQDCGLNTQATNDDKYPCFKIRINKVVTNPFGNTGGLLNLTGASQDQYQNANNTRTEYVVDIVVRHMCLDRSTASSPKGCVFSRYQQKIRKREFIQHIVMSQSESVAPQVYEKVTNIALQDRVKSLDNAYAANDSVTGNIHTNDSHVYVCDGFGVTQGTGNINWITSGFDSTSGSSSAIAAAASSTSNFTACNGSSGASVARFSASRDKFPLPQRIGDDNGVRLTSISKTNDATKYYLNGNDIRIDFRYDRSGTDQSKWDKTTMMHPVIDGQDKDWYSIPSNGVLSINPSDGNGTVSVSGKLKGQLTIFSTGSINVANSFTYVDASMKTDFLGLYANKDIVLNCYNDSSPQTGKCDDKQVDGLLWAGKQTLVQSPSDPNVYNVDYEGTIYNDHWNDSAISDLNNPPKLTIRGALISYHRGTFGTIESNGSGKVTGGWSKNFIWDSRLESSQPPYMLRDALASFIRSTTKDIPCDNACS